MAWCVFSKIWLPCRKAITRLFIKSFIDQACSVMMAGFLPCSFLVCYLWSINKQKNLVNFQPFCLTPCILHGQ